MKIGIIGSGNIGANAARLFVHAGHTVALSNSRVGWFGGMPGQPSPPPLMSQVGIGGVLEFFGGQMTTKEKYDG